MSKLARLFGIKNDKSTEDKVQEKLPENTLENAVETVEKSDKPVSVQDEEIKQEETEESNNSKVNAQMIGVELIIPNPFQPRKLFNDETLQELAASIKEYGIIQPLLVRPTENGYELIAGERRLRASKIVGLTEVPVVVRAMPDKEMAELAMIENLQREDLHYLEEALGYQTLLAEFDITQDEMAQRLGKSQSTIANKLRLLRLPDDVQTALIDYRLTERHARALLKLDNPEFQREILAKVSQDGLNVRETENIIEDVLATKKTAKKKKQKTVNMVRDARIFINSIHRLSADMKKAGLGIIVEEEQDDDFVLLHLKIAKRRVKNK